MNREVLIIRRVRNCLSTQSTMRQNTKQLLGHHSRIAKACIPSKYERSTLHRQDNSSQDFSSLHPGRMQLDSLPYLQGLDITMHQHRCDFSHKSTGIDEDQVALYGFSQIVGFFIFKALLVVSFVRNASVFPADMHKSRYVAMPHDAIGSAAALDADLERKFYSSTFESTDWRNQDFQL